MAQILEFQLSNNNIDKKKIWKTHDYTTIHVKPCAQALLSAAQINSIFLSITFIQSK